MTSIIQALETSTLKAIPLGKTGLPLLNSQDTPNAEVAQPCTDIIQQRKNHPA
jgi:hypothetical protein